MRKWILLFSISFFLLTSSFNSFKSTSSIPERLKVTEGSFFYSVKQEAPLFFLTPFLKNDYNAFKEALGFRESQGDYSSVNTLGYLGKYQFGKSTLDLLGVKDYDKFLNTPRLQDRVLYLNTCRNKWVLRKYINWYQGKTIDGVEITESGILAAAHLAGPVNVKEFLNSMGKDNFSDSYGTKVSEYMKLFAGYDMSFVIKNRKAKI